ncbi:gp53-like domain-containing protein, partial [Psittacicella hinzii]
RQDQITADTDALDVFDTWQGAVTDALTLRANDAKYNVNGQVYFDQNDKTLSRATKAASSDNKTIWSTDYNMEGFPFAKIYQQRQGNSGANHELSNYYNDLILYQDGLNSADLRKTPNQLVTMEFFQKVITQLTFAENSPRNYSSSNTELLSGSKSNGADDQWSFKVAGLTIKMGIVNRNEWKGTVSFTKAFENQVLNIQLTGIANSTSSKTDCYVDQATKLNPKEGFNFLCSYRTNNKSYFYWLAIGY